MALPVFNEQTLRYHDPESSRMVKTSAAESAISAAGTPFNKESTALGGGSGILESILAVVTESAGYLKAMAPSQSEIRGESIEDANVAPDPNEGRDDAPAMKGPGLLGRMKNKFSLGMLLKGGLILALTGIMAFADEFAKLLEPVLKFIKEKAWPNAVDVFTDFMEKGRKLFSGLSDKLSIIFGDSGGPHGVTLLERVKAFAGIFADIGGFILGIGNSLITNVLEMFGVNFDPYDSAGAWMLGKLNDMWDGLKGWFTGLAAKWPILGDIGAWVLEKATAAFAGVVTFFTGAIGAFEEGGFKGVWEYVKQKVLDAFKPITEFFTSAIGAYDEGGFSGLWEWTKDKLKAVWTKLTSFFTLAKEAAIDLDGKLGILDWIKDKLAAPFAFLKDLFSWPEKPKEGYFSFEFGGKIMSKFIDLVFLPWNLAINFLKGIFGFTAEEAEKDPKYEPFKMSTFLVKLVGDAWDWVKSKFKFDIPKFEMPEIPSISEMISGIVGAILPSTTGFIGRNLYKLDKMKGALEMRQMYEASELAQELEGVPSGTTAQLGAETAAFRLATAGAGMGAQYIDAANNAITTVSQDTYTAQELEVEDTSFWGKALSIINPFD